MENRKTKKEIVQMLLKRNFEENDEEELINMLTREPIAVDVDKQSDEKRTFGDKVADKIAEIAGSWAFILCMILFLILWIILNLFVLKDKDPYPFILLNLILSCIAALQATIIMMSQNRKTKKDRASELILEELHTEIKQIIINQNKILKYLNNEDQK